MMRSSVKRSVISVVLAAAALATPAAVFAQQRYVPSYEPSYTPAAYTVSGYSLLGAYSLASVDRRANSTAKVASRDVEPVAQLIYAAAPSLELSGLKLLAPPVIDLAQNAMPPRPMLLASRR